MERRPDSMDADGSSTVPHVDDEFQSVQWKRGVWDCHQLCIPMRDAARATPWFFAVPFAVATEGIIAPVPSLHRRRTSLPLRVPLLFARLLVVSACSLL